MTDKMISQLADNLARIRTRIERACARANRGVDAVTLVAVTKYANLEWVRGLIELGATDLGESRPQQLAARSLELGSGLNWHLIGHLQRNKVESILPVVQRIHSVDSVRLIDAIDAAARKLSLRPRILLEANVSGEDSKDGFNVDELLAAWPAILQKPAIQIDGLMTMAPLNDDVEVARPVFRRLRELRDRLNDLSAGQCRLNDLSMGMSGDFEIGIEEGATLIRIGSSLFDGLSV